jgi:membrane protease YdiL (CAAX protease family)
VDNAVLPGVSHNADRGVLLRFCVVLLAGTIVLGPLIYLVFHRWVPFHRAMDRALLISALSGLALAWPRLRWSAWWPWRRAALGQVLLGLFIALLSVQTILALDAGMGGLKWAVLTWPERRHVFLSAMLAALIVPFAEETIFRGFLQTEFTRRLGFRWGWLLAALVYALAHFLKIPDAVDHVPIHPWSGVSALGAAFLPLVHGDFLSGRGANLLVIGMILGGMFWRTGTLWLNYGLHAGWIAGLLLGSGLSRPARVTLWTGDGLLSSPLTTIVLAVLGWWLWRFYRRPQPGSASGATPS